uniref:Uncharacterized protein n=1 Tax=Lepeophtheirus salmonis TaxID=72036 RepID=A0A0K2U260_LEPSM
MYNIYLYEYRYETIYYLFILFIVFLGSKEMTKLQRVCVFLCLGGINY